MRSSMMSQLFSANEQRAISAIKLMYYWEKDTVDRRKMSFAFKLLWLMNKSDFNFFLPDTTRPNSDCLWSCCPMDQVSL